MSEPAVLVAIIGAVVSILLPVIAIFGTIINSKLNTAGKERNEQAVKLESIHQLTNSNLQAANARLDKALEQIKVLQELMATMRQPDIKLKVLEQEIDTKAEI